MKVVFLAVCAGYLAVTAAAFGAEEAAARHEALAKACVEVLIDRHLNGSGWLAPERGYAFTAAHVVAGKHERLEVRLHDGRVLPASVLARDFRHDAALLRVAANAQDLPAGLTFAPQPPAVGETVWVFGAPQYRHGVILPGTVASAALTYEWLGALGHGIECRHVAATAPKGMSGGPWVDSANRLVGLQSGGMTERDVFCGISFVTPAAAFVALLESKRDVPVAWFGAAVEELEEQGSAEIRRFPPEASGLIVKSLAKGGPAARCGLADGTLLCRCAGKVLITRNAFYQLLATLRPGDELELETLAPGQTKPRVVKVRLGD